MQNADSFIRRYDIKYGTKFQRLNARRTAEIYTRDVIIASELP